MPDDPNDPLDSLLPVLPVFTDAERIALAGFLAGYRGLTREAYTLNPLQFTGWCRARSLPLFSVRRVDIETFARELEAGRSSRWSCGSSAPEGNSSPRNSRGEPTVGPTVGPPRLLPWVANSPPRSRLAPQLTGHPSGEAGPDCSSSATCRVSRCDSPATRISSSEAFSSAISALSAPGSACRISSSLRWVAACWRA